MPLLACEGQGAGQDGGLDGDGYEEIQHWGACPFPYTRPREHALVDEMGVERTFLEQHVRCRLRHEALEAEILIKARPVRADMSRGAEYEAARAFVCRDGQVEEIPVELCQFVWRHHNWKDIMIVIDERRYVLGFSEMCLGARPCTPWPDEFDVRLQADASLIAEGLPCECAAVGEGGVPEPGCEPVTHAEMQTFLDELAAVLRTHNPTALLTVGGAAIKWGTAWRGVDQDFYSLHYYDWVYQWYPYDRVTPASIGLTDRPVVIGEYPIQGLGAVGGRPARTAAEYSADLWSLGCAGSLAWAFNDPGFPWDAGLLRDFAAAHPCETAC